MTEYIDNDPPTTQINVINLTLLPRYEYETDKQDSHFGVRPFKMGEIGEGTRPGPKLCR